jgi:SAM-dependent methyltransferase
MLHLVDLGCGSGGLLKHLARWARKSGVKLRLTGVDRSLHAIRLLKRNCIGFPEISGVIMEYDQYLKTEPAADIYLCSLFCHHLNDTQLIELFTYLKRAKTGFIISDLHRGALAFYGAQALTWIFNGTVLSRKDGPASVLKAFKKKELEQFMEHAGITHYSIRLKWAFRFIIVVQN